MLERSVGERRLRTTPIPKIRLLREERILVQGTTMKLRCALEVRSAEVRSVEELSVMKKDLSGKLRAHEVDNGKDSSRAVRLPPVLEKTARRAKLAPSNVATPPKLAP